MPDRLIDRRQLADKLGRDIGWLYKNLRKLEARGFPCAVIANAWSEGAIDQWFKRQSFPQGQPVPEPPDPDAPDPLTEKMQADDLANRVALLLTDH